MSGICGIVYFDRKPVDPQALRRMAQAAAYRGPDGIQTWHTGNVGLGYLAFHTTPESIRAQQPLLSKDGNICLVADARIDNRAELIPTLMAAGCLPNETPTDDELILAAYQHWQEHCPKHLIGDFAFAIWDGAEQQLFMARDPIGVRQLFYTKVDEAFFFASAIDPVLVAFPQRPPLNRPLLNIFLSGSVGPWVCETVYEGIFRIPPAHTLTLNENGATARLYYQFGEASAPEITSDTEWLEAFRALFEDAVRCRLRSVAPVALLVSGGLDSSAIACAAYQLQKQDCLPPIRMYTSIFEDTPNADEKQYFDAVAAKCPSWPSTRIPSDDLWAFSEFGSDNNFPLEEPDIFPLRSHTLALLRVPAADGCRVVVSGALGEGFLGLNTYFEPETIRYISWQDRLLEIEHYRRLTGKPFSRIIFDAFLRPQLPGTLQRIWRTVRRASSNQRPWLSREAGLSDPKRHPLMSARLGSEKLDPIAKFIYYQTHSAYNITRLSSLGRMGAYAGIEWRYPYLDIRLVEFLLQIPQHLRSWRGMDRVILRQSMQDVLPKPILGRQSKARFDQLVSRGFARESGRLSTLFQDSLAEALGFLDKTVYSDELAAYGKGRRKEFRSLLHPLFLESWLKEIFKT